MKKIGFVGLGIMGSGMVRNLLKNGFPVCAYNRTRARAEEISHENFLIADSPAEACEKSDIVITCVSNDAALRDVLFSGNGILNSLDEGKIFVDCSTVSVGITNEIADECKKRKAEFLDAPITGGKAGAEQGNLMFMVGGNKKTADELMHVFNAMGKRVVYCGTNTYGQRAKIALNLAQSLVLQGYFEGLVLGIKNGVSLDSMLEILDNSGARSGVSTARVPNVLKRDFSPHFKLELMNKDIGLAMQEIEKLELDLPLSRELAKVFGAAMEKGWKEEDYASIVKVIEEKAGVKLERKISYD